MMFINTIPALLLIVLNVAAQDESIRFQLYTRKNPDVPQIVDERSLRKSNFNRSARTWMYVHGINDGPEEALVKRKDVVLKRWNENVICVDWSDIGRSAKDGLKAWLSLDIVGIRVARFIDGLKRNLHYDHANIGMAGYSFGSHICGIAGSRVEGGFLGSIYGSDPPMYPFDPNLRLNRDNAAYVEVVHTTGMLGAMVSPHGHVDVYVNGGLLQPQCGRVNVIDTFFCSHWSADIVYDRALSGNLVASECPEGFWQAIAGGAGCVGGANLTVGGYYPKPWKGGVYFLNYTDLPRLYGV